MGFLSVAAGAGAGFAVGGPIGAAIGGLAGLVIGAPAGAAAAAAGGAAARSSDGSVACEGGYTVYYGPDGSRSPSTQLCGGANDGMAAGNTIGSGDVFTPDPAGSSAGSSGGGAATVTTTTPGADVPDAAKSTRPGAKVSTQARKTFAPNAGNSAADRAQAEADRRAQAARDRAAREQAARKQADADAAAKRARDVQAAAAREQAARDQRAREQAAREANIYAIAAQHEANRWYTVIDPSTGVEVRRERPPTTVAALDRANNPMYTPALAEWVRTHPVASQPGARTPTQYYAPAAAPGSIAAGVSNVTRVDNGSVGGGNRSSSSSGGAGSSKSGGKSGGGKGGHDFSGVHARIRGGW